MKCCSCDGSEVGIRALQELGARAAQMKVAAAKLAGELAEYKAESRELRKNH